MSPSMSDVKLLGPGPATEHGLVAFTKGFQRAKDAFEKLLQYPHLEAMKYSNDENNNGTFGATKNLREFLIEGQSCFRIATERDRQAATNLLAYGEFVGPFLVDQSLAR